MEFSKFFQLNTSFSKGDKSFEANSACKNSEGSFIHGSITFKQVGITVDGCTFYALIYLCVGIKEKFQAGGGRRTANYPRPNQIIKMGEYCVAGKGDVK